MTPIQHTIKHDATFNSDGSLRPGMRPPATPIEALGYPHPVLRVVPTTGDDALFLGRRLNGYVHGMELAGKRAATRRGVGARDPTAVLLSPQVACGSGCGMGQSNVDAQTFSHGREQESIHVENSD